MGSAREKRTINGALAIAWIGSIIFAFTGEYSFLAAMLIVTAISVAADKLVSIPEYHEKQIRFLGYIERPISRICLLAFLATVTIIILNKLY